MVTLTVTLHIIVGSMRNIKYAIMFKYDTASYLLLLLRNMEPDIISKF